MLTPALAPNVDQKRLSELWDWGVMATVMATQLALTIKTYYYKELIRHPQT